MTYRPMRFGAAHIWEPWPPVREHTPWGAPPHRLPGGQT